MSTPRRHPAGVLHRPADPAAPGQPAHHRRLPRHAASCCWPSPPSSTGKPALRLDIADLDAPLIGAFLDHLETDRGNSVRTRNARLAAIHSLFRYAALRHPEHAADIQRVLAIPPKRFDRTLVTYLTEPEARRAAGRARPRHLDRAPRPRPAPAGRPDRAARLRAHRADHRRRPPRHRRARQLPRQRPQAADHPADRRHRRRPARLARRTRRPRPTDPLFPTRRGDPLAATPSNDASPTTPPPPPASCPTLAEQERSRRTSCGTPRPCGCCTPASTPPSSRCGSATKPSPPPRSTSTPTSRSRNKRSPAPRRRPHAPGRYQPPDTLLAFLDSL